MTICIFSIGRASSTVFGLSSPRRSRVVLTTDHRIERLKQADEQHAELERLRTWFKFEVAAFHARNAGLADANDGRESSRIQPQSICAPNNGFGDDGTGFGRVAMIIDGSCTMKTRSAASMSLPGQVL